MIWARDPFKRQLVNMAIGQSVQIEWDRNYHPANLIYRFNQDFKIQLRVKKANNEYTVTRIR